MTTVKKKSFIESPLGRSSNLTEENVFSINFQRSENVKQIFFAKIVFPISCLIIASLMMRTRVHLMVVWLCVNSASSQKCISKIQAEEYDINNNFSSNNNYNSFSYNGNSKQK